MGVVVRHGENRSVEPPFSDDKFVAGITGAVAEDYAAVFIDSLSHSWTETLNYKATLDSRGGNSYTNWGAAGKKFNNVITSALQSKINVIASLRSKMEYVLETDFRGKQVPRKIGLQPVMRDGIEYEFGVVFDIGSDHCATCSKDRTSLFIDQDFQITEATGTQLHHWLNSAPEPEPEQTVQEQLATELSDIDSKVLSAFLMEKKKTETTKGLSITGPACDANFQKYSPPFGFFEQAHIAFSHLYRAA